MTEPSAATAVVVDAPKDRVARATVTITAWNLVSRITGFLRVIVTGAALGIKGLGDTYQTANVVSNIMFELLAGGILYSVLVPTFVGLIDRDKRKDATRLAGALQGRMVVLLSGLVVAGVLAGRWIMRAFTLGGTSAAVRQQQIDLGAFLLWFFLPQLLLYAVGAVATALLQADRRFVAAAVAPIFNNMVVIATMVAFVVLTPKGVGLDLDLNAKIILGLGTSLGVLAMTVVPVVALFHAGLPTLPRWSVPPGLGLGKLARKGAWGAGHVGLNELLGGVTLVLAHQVIGGQAAYQMAFTFFLLPFAVLANPIFTALFPKLSAHAVRDDQASYARDLSLGVRATTVLVLPAAGLLAVLALPGLSVLRGFGQLDETGLTLVAAVVAAYAVGLLGYSAFFLLTRASYALDDVRTPTIVNLFVTVGAIAGMVVASMAVSGSGKVVVLGLVHGVAITIGSLVLLRLLHARSHHPIPWVGALGRAALGTAVACAGAWVVSHGIGWSSRPTALASVLAAGLVGVVLYSAVLVLTHAPELDPVLSRLSRLRRWGRRGKASA